ncbi:cupin domain-containing protein [Oceanicoccus sp. KOV_DT_Chl]|uniref:cupin domain-containing protein n=1 Tax=Oceanicoccus sp. KOV_DT_Chl TaxID=1904639 RepID=UPI000C7A0103|nr:cupin domain-containing protein [Oceanicoccus sp. KOV_DT_Chl]
MPIQNFNIEQFLANKWQQKPLLIKQAFPDFSNPVSADELAGLACEEEIESRIVTATDNQWQLHHGPFAESDFQQFGDGPWTLLVQAVDHWVPEVAELLNHFRFIPSWRIDDVMVSYATRGGSVGPHFDNYDVFLLQGAGSRRWLIGPQYDSKTPLQDNNALQLVDDFNTQQELLLQPGDMLYIPPGYGHWGIANDNDCMTYSIGFRAPSHAELLSDFCDEKITDMTAEQRYSDAKLTPQTHSGEITEQAIDRVQTILNLMLTNRAEIVDWFGRYMTQEKYPEEQSLFENQALSHTDFLQCFEQQNILLRNPAARFAYSQQNGTHQLYINGETYSAEGAASAQLIEVLADHQPLIFSHMQPLLSDPQSLNLLVDLFNQGIVYFDDEHCD